MWLAVFVPEIYAKNTYFLCFFVFFSMRNTSGHIILVYLEMSKTRLQFMYCGKKFPNKECGLALNFLDTLKLLVNNGKLSLLNLNHLCWHLVHLILTQPLMLLLQFFLLWLLAFLCYTSMPSVFSSNTWKMLKSGNTAGSSELGHFWPCKPISIFL